VRSLDIHEVAGAVEENGAFFEVCAEAVTRANGKRSPEWLPS
jgi:hypothetical protein